LGIILPHLHEEIGFSPLQFLKLHERISILFSEQQNMKAIISIRIYPSQVLVREYNLKITDTKDLSKFWSREIIFLEKLPEG
jgi:hypothetical protein